MCAEFFAIANDIVLMLSAVTGATVAVIGLTTWKKQAKWNVEYDLAQAQSRSLH